MNEVGRIEVMAGGLTELVDAPNDGQYRVPPRYAPCPPTPVELQLEAMAARPSELGLGSMLDDALSRLTGQVFEPAPIVTLH